jgi:hypothetical protein
MLYREIIAVCSEIHTKHINKLCGQDVDLSILKLRYIIYPLDFKGQERLHFCLTLHSRISRDFHKEQLLFFHRTSAGLSSFCTPRGTLSDFNRKIALRQSSSYSLSYSEDIINFLRNFGVYKLTRRHVSQYPNLHPHRCGRSAACTDDKPELLWRANVAFRYCSSYSLQVVNYKVVRTLNSLHKSLKNKSCFITLVQKLSKNLEAA